VAFVAIAIIALGTFACFLMTPKYSATATIEVEQENQIEGGSGSSATNQPTSDELRSEIQTDLGILMSQGLAIRVITQLNLQQWPPFDRFIDPGERGRSLAESPHTRESMFKLFERNLKVTSPEDTRLINITYQNSDPVLAANIANALSHLFIEDAMERHQRLTAQASYWLQQELDDLKKQVETSEQNLADYERQSGLAGIELSGDSSGNGTSSVAVSPHNTITERLFALNQELTQAEANRISTEMVYRLVQTQDPEVVLGLGTMNGASAIGGAGGTLTSDSGIELVRTLRAQEGALSRQYAGLAATYGPNDSKMIQMQQQMDAVKQQMQAELDRIRQRAANAYLYAKRNESTIRQQFTEQQSAADAMADKTVKLQVLGQEAYSNRALYENLFSKLQTASLASGVRAARIDLVDQARPAGSPSSPEYAKYIALIAGFGLFAGITAAFLRESMDQTLRSPRHLTEAFNLPMLGYVPNFFDKKLLKAGDGGSQLISAPQSPYSESFRAIRTAILLGIPATNSRSILVTSAIEGEGKTVTVYNLGVAFAQQGARVLLIDADLRNPQLHRHFGAELSPGLSNCVGEAASQDVSHVVRHSTLPTLYMLAAGKQPDLPTELFGTAAFEALLRTSEARYDYLLIDSPPMLPVADASVIAAKVGGIIAVVRSGYTTRALFSALVQSLDRTRTPVLGIVLNDVRPKFLEDAYGYSYSHVKKSPTSVPARTNTRVAGRILFPILLCLALSARCTLHAQGANAPLVGGESTLNNPPDISGNDATSARHRLSTLTVIPEDFSTLKLAPGFLLSIDVYDAPEFSSDLRVGEDGDVLVESVGRVHVAGQTLAEASAAIAKRLQDAKILNNPQINLNIVQYAGQSVTVLGEVHNPGRLELLAPHTLADVMAMSGGETQYAGNLIEIRRRTKNGLQTESVHFSRSAEDATLEDTQVYPGDTVTVRRAGIVYVLGGVARPGGYIMQEGGELTLTQALALAYGTNIDAAVSSVLIIRKLPDGKVEQIPVAYRAIMKGKEAPPRLQAEDVVYVPISKTKTVLSAGLLSATAQAAIYTHP
jgi:capsular exopolysaccharide synthesis family protein